MIRIAVRRCFCWECFHSASPLEATCMEACSMFIPLALHAFPGQFQSDSCSQIRVPGHSMEGSPDWAPGTPSGAPLDWGHPGTVEARTECQSILLHAHAWLKHLLASFAVAPQDKPARDLECQKEELLLVVASSSCRKLIGDVVVSLFDARQVCSIKSFTVIDLTLKFQSIETQVGTAFPSEVGTAFPTVDRSTLSSKVAFDLTRNFLSRLVLCI